MAGLFAVAALLLVLMAGLSGATLELFLRVADGVSCPTATDWTLRLQPVALVALLLVLPVLDAPSSNNNGTSFEPVTDLGYIQM
jgi:hypothetical protein